MHNLADDLPKPSPRNRKSKGQAAATLAKLTEPKNLKVLQNILKKEVYFHSLKSAEQGSAITRFLSI